MYIAAHGNDHIHLRNIRQELAKLRFLHIDAMNLFHQPDSILVDIGFGFCACRVTLKNIGRKLLSHGLEEDSERQRPKMLPIPWVWQSLHT